MVQIQQVLGWQVWFRIEPLLEKQTRTPGMDVQTALNAKLKAYFLMGVEPGFDFANPYGARQSMLGCGICCFNVCL